MPWDARRRSRRHRSPRLVLRLFLYSLDPQEVFEAVARQTAALGRPPITLDNLLDRMAVTFPDFVDLLRRHE